MGGHVAITVPRPSVAADLITLKQASDLFAECGKEYEVDPRTLKRWAVKHQVRTRRAGRDVIASWTDLLEVHAKEIDRREAGRA
jgi:hypothetical protein